MQEIILGALFYALVAVMFFYVTKGAKLSDGKSTIHLNSTLLATVWPLTLVVLIAAAMFGKVKAKE